MSARQFVGAFTHDALVDDIIRYESGEMDETEAIAFFGRLVSSGTIMVLQGSYQRGALALMRDGYLSPTGEVLIEVAE
jgi:hypothetical protein